MFALRLSPVRSAALLVMILLLAFAAYGFANSNTMPATSQAGDGNVAISGFAVTNIHYVLNAANPRNLDGVTFNIAPAVPAGGTVKVQITDGATTTWHSCTGGAAITCDLTVSSGGTPTTVTVLGANNLRVVAAD